MGSADAYQALAAFDDFVPEFLTEGATPPPTLNRLNFIHAHFSTNKSELLHGEIRGEMHTDESAAALQDAFTGRLPKEESDLAIKGRPFICRSFQNVKTADPEGTAASWFCMGMVAHPQTG